MEQEIITLCVTDYLSWRGTAAGFLPGITAGLIYYTFSRKQKAGLAVLCAVTGLIAGLLIPLLYNLNAAIKETAQKRMENLAETRLTEIQPYRETGPVEALLAPPAEEPFLIISPRYEDGKNGNFFLHAGSDTDVSGIVRYGYRRILAEARMTLEPAFDDIMSRPWITERSPSPDRIRERAESFLRELSAFPAANILIEGKGWYSLTATALLKDFVPPQDDTAAAWYSAFEKSFDGAEIPESVSATVQWAEQNLKFISPYTFADRVLMTFVHGTREEEKALAEQVWDEGGIVLRVEI